MCGGLETLYINSQKLRSDVSSQGNMVKLSFFFFNHRNAK